jgi:hypothetical protein
MRKLSIFLVLVTAAVLVKPATSAAQGAVSQYPWCYERNFGGSRSCYYASYEQCQEEAFSRGGFCVRSPYYHPPAAGTPRVRSRHHRHS